MSEQLGNPDIRPEILKTLAFADKVIAGGPNLPMDDPQRQDSFDPSTIFSGPLYDLNDPATSPQEEAAIIGWIENKLGGKIADFPTRTSYRAADGKTTLRIFNKPLGEEGDKWFISEWRQEGEGQKPYYVFWQEEMYDTLELDGYEPIE